MLLPLCLGHLPESKSKNNVNLPRDVCNNVRRRKKENQTHRKGFPQGQKKKEKVILKKKKGASKKKVKLLKGPAGR